jgi:hypothetical protein
MGKVMNLGDKSKAGMADPYWYEWSVGQNYILDMLNPDNHIKFVELQANVNLGLDDVVVTYDDGKVRFIQVKHTRTDNSLTFGDLVSSEVDNTGKVKKNSLLGELAKSWNEEKKKSKNTEVFIFTNRKAGASVAIAGTEVKIKRPKLQLFLNQLQEKVNVAETYSEIEFPDWNGAWNEWSHELRYIENDEDKLLFLKSLHIETEQADLDTIKQELLTKLKLYLCVDDKVAESLLAKLDHALRKWTTSSRKKTEINIEDVYSALSMFEDIKHFNHDLIPVNPFFESRQKFINDIEAELKLGNSKVLFISGLPGIGKTNIISKLCGKRDSIVDIRYYAYEPIDPSKEYFTGDVSARVNKEVFWNTLLDQLRIILDGKLYRYKVPVSNLFLTLDQKRKEFMRIASEYASDEHRDFILVIDGIDHAARAGIFEDTFLRTLQNPEHMPDNVKMVLTGQPKEVYKNYPDWLYQKDDTVKELIVPQIDSNDIENLVHEKCVDFSLNDQAFISKLVCQYAEGNTLAAIFGVHEATLCDTIADLEQRLIDRKLGGNIQEYYRSIWENAKNNMRVPFVDYKMAGVFAFFNEPINAKKLRQIFPYEDYSESVWNNVLKALSPLLIKKDGSYVVLHNDVRVYLAGVIGKDQENVMEIYSDLADYYIKLPEKNLAYYHDVIRFLLAAGRKNELDKVYSPKYIIEAYVLGVELDELRSVSNLLLRNIVEATQIDWELLRSLSFGYVTIDQIEKSGYEIEDASFRLNNRNINIHEYECFTLPYSEWTKDILDTVFALIIDLFENEEKKRGETLFYNWFENISYSDIQNILEDKNECVNYDANSIACDLGKVCVYTKSFKLLECGNKATDSRILQEAIGTAEEKAFEILCNNDLYQALEALPVLYINPLIKGIKLLIDSNRKNDLLVLSQVICKRDVPTNSISYAIRLFLQIITESIQLSRDEANEVFEEMKEFKISDSIFETEMSFYSLYTFVLAYLHGDSSNVGNMVAKKYLAANKYKKSQYFVLYFNFISNLGRWYRLRANGKKYNANVEELSTMISNLFEKKWRPNDTDYESFSLKMFALKGIIILSEGENGSFKKQLRETFDRLFNDNPANQLLDLGMLFYRKDKIRMQSWIDDWLSDNGRVWNEPIGERNRIVKEFIAAKKKYDLENVLSLRNAEDRIRWSIIGFASHKEYTGYTLLNWYNKLIERNDKYIEEYAARVKEVSDKIELLGDNRIAYLLNSKVYDDFGFAGFKVVKKILNNSFLLEQCILNPSYFVDILIGYLRRYESTRNELLKIWSLGIGILDWKNEDDHATILALQKAIELCAEKQGIKDIKSSLSILSPANIDLSADSVKYVIPERWCDKKYNYLKGDESKRIISDYFSDASVKPSNYDTSKAIASLCELGELSNDECIEYLNKETVQNNYSVHHDSIIRILIENGPHEEVDRWIKEYLKASFDRKYFYPEQEIPDLIEWRLKSFDEKFVKDSVDLLIQMNKSWITMNGHIEEPELDYSNDYLIYMDMEKEDICDLYFEILLLFIKSEDADAARTALEGIAAVLRVDFHFISKIENSWNQFHYRAKEWMLMVYEFIYRMCPETRTTIFEYLKVHSKDNDFNVAVYSKILCENIDGSFSELYDVEYKDFFEDIPVLGSKGLIKTSQKKPWVNGSDYVVGRIEKLQKYLMMDLKDIERRTADYSLKLGNDENELIPLKRQKHGGCKVVLDKTNLAFLRVLYKEWYNGRWEKQDAMIARCIISASEPYVLLLSPMKWKWNNGTFFADTKKIITINQNERNDIIQDVLAVGLSSDQIVLGGKIEDYTYNKFIIGVSFLYFAIPGIDSMFVAYQSEENARLILKSRSDYVEGRHPNITIFQNGIESFIHSNLDCGICNTPLNIFGWKIVTEDNEIKIKNSQGMDIGRFESFYGNRTDIGVRSVIEQPYMQRWIVNKYELEKALSLTNCPYEISVVTDSIINDISLR